MNKEEKTLNKKAIILQAKSKQSAGQLKLSEKRARKYLEEHGYEVIGALPVNDHEEQIKGAVNAMLHSLSDIIKEMSKCHAIYFPRGWERSKGCGICEDIAKEYGLFVIRERTSFGR